MADLSHLSDAELETIANSGGQAPAPAPRAPRDLSGIPDAELEKIAGANWERASVLPFERNSATGEKRMAIPGVVKSVVDAVMLPGDVAKGDADINSPEGWQRVFDLGTMLMPGPRAGNKLVTPAGNTVPKAVTRAIKSDGVAPGGIPGQLDAIGPEAVLGDLGPNLQAQTAAVATMPGAGQKTVVDAMTARKTGAPERLRTALDENLGPAPVPADVKAGLKDQRKALSPEYEAVFPDAKPVDNSALAKALDEQIPVLRGDAQTQLKNARKMLNQVGGEPADAATIIANETDMAKRTDLVRRHLAGEKLETGAPLSTDARTLFETRKAIDGLVGSTTDTNVQRVLLEARKSIDATLAEAVPGIKEIDARHSDIRKTGDAFEKGQTVLGNGRETPRPAELQADVVKANNPSGSQYGPSSQGFALKQGARAEIDRIVGTNLNDRAALNSLLKGEGDWNHARLTTLFGPERTNAIYKVLENERLMAETENRALSGSKTAAVTAAQGEVNTPAKPSVMGAAGDLHFGTALRNLKDVIMSNVAERQQTGRNSAMADVLTSRDALKPNTTGRYPKPNAAMLDAIMRGPAPPEPDRAKRRQFLNDQRVY